MFFETCFDTWGVRIITPVKVAHGMSNEERAAVTLRLPSTLSAYSGGKSQIPLWANTMEQLLEALAQVHPQVWERLCTPDGQIRPHVKIFVNNVMVTGTQGLQTPLKPGQEIIVFPSISRI